MQPLLDILASGVHDTKNQLFQAEALTAEQERIHTIDLSDIRYAIEAAAQRLSRTLAAYRLLRDDAVLGITPCIVADLIEDVALDQRKHLQHLGIALEIDCQVVDEWPLDRDLISDMLNNALQNAGRYARSRIRLSAHTDAEGLIISIADDGPGFDAIPPTTLGTGLLVAERLATLHVRHGRNGQLLLSNNSTLGGALFELRLP